MAAGGVILALIAASAAAYQFLALVACLVFWVQRKRALGRAPRGPQPGGVSILKPVRGLDPGFRGAIASHLALEGDFEVLVGVRGVADPALGVLEDFPQVRLVGVETGTPNGKVGALIDLVREARHPILIVSDSDIVVEPDYLARVTAPLQDPRVGLVTCLYRPQGATFPARFEGLGISTDFAPSTLVARLAGVDEFALGSTLAFRRADLERIGGFEAIAGHLADDYQLGHRIHELGLKCVLSEVVVETRMDGAWADVWRHQVRWARTIRVSRFWGYLGLPVTFATVWAVVAAALGRWEPAMLVLGVRMLMATVAGWLVAGSRDLLPLWPLIPLRDLFGCAVWLAGLFGRTVVWRGLTLRLGPGGRIA
jgi:ceramide glucosyltransferase